jgi:hypothetical protein
MFGVGINVWNVQDAFGLSLDLQFAADKTLDARTGPTLTLTRATTATFVGSDGLIQSAAVDAARFDHDPVTLACKGLLIEEERTNQSLRSEDIVNNIGWSLVDVTSVVSGTSPNGNSSYQISETNTVANHLLVNTGSNTATAATSVVSGTSYTGSIFVKKVVGSVDWVQLSFAAAGFGSAQFANFNISNGTVGNYAGLTSETVPRIEEFPNGWYRCSITATATATTSSTSNIVLCFTNNNNIATRFISYLGSTLNSVLASLCQVEAGTFPTSYIPTTTAALLRSADFCSIGSADFENMANNVKATILCESVVNGNSNSNAADTFFIGQSVDDGIYLRQTGSGAEGTISAFTSYVFSSQLLNTSTGALRKVAMAFDSSNESDGDGVLYQNGILGSDSENGLSYIDIASFFYDSGLTLFRGQSSTIKSFRYFNRRLPNAKLQSLTKLVSDTDANAYISAVAAVGATVTTAQQTAINEFFIAGKVDGWYSSIKRLYLPIWGAAAPNAICMLSLTSGTFVGNVTHNAGSVSTTAPTGHFLVSATPASLGINQDNASIWTLVASGIHEFSGCGGASSSRLLIGRVGLSNSACIPSTTSLITGSTDTQGINMASRIGSDLSLFQRKTSGWITPLTLTQANTTALPLIGPSFLGNFNSSGTVSTTRTSVGEYGSYGYGLGMTSVQAEAFSIALKSLFETATGKILP